MTCLAVLPVRLASHRLPGKALLNRTGKYLFQHTLEGVQASKRVDQTLVATDSPEVAQAAENIGAKVCMTSPEHRCGTERVTEVLDSFPEASWVLNVQADYPEVQPGDVDALVGRLQRGDVDAATLAIPWTPGEDPTQPNVVKVVQDGQGRALYFSRSPIPAAFRLEEPDRLRHLGIYGFARKTLEAYAGLEPSPAEKAEGLEQLRLLENGFSMGVAVVQSPARGIESPEDYEAFVARTGS